MQTHVINIQLRVEARDDISRADLMSDLRRQLAALSEQAPYRSIHGSGWWTNSDSAVAMLKYAGIAEQAEYEAEVRAEREAAEVRAEREAAEEAAEPWAQHNPDPYGPRPGDRPDSHGMVPRYGR
jgi:hypothetical protein